MRDQFYGYLESSDKKKAEGSQKRKQPLPKLTKMLENK